MAAVPVADVGPLPSGFVAGSSDVHPATSRTMPNATHTRDFTFIPVHSPRRHPSQAPSS
jgi:hypothetical protein